MAYTDGIPMPGASAAPAYVGRAHPFNWLDRGGNEAAGIDNAAAQRGRPVPFSWWQRRNVAQTPTVPFAGPVYHTSRPYSRGAEAHAPVFGQLAYNPIGAGIYAPYKLPPMAGPGARYMAAAIWFDVQTIGTSINFGPTVPIETINALIATSHVGPSYLTTG